MDLPSTSISDNAGDISDNCWYIYQGSVKLILGDSHMDEH